MPFARQFYEIFKASAFHKIGSNPFARAAVAINNIRTGHILRFGYVNVNVP